MSWAEDMGYDIGIEASLEHLYIETNWKNGWHETRDGRIIDIEDMETSHIENTIKYFSYLDTRPLERELQKRKLPTVARGTNTLVRV